jgi:hypothetical protein
MNGTASVSGAALASRSLAALLALVLSAAPALGALCGMDCGSAEAHSAAGHTGDSDSHDGAHHPSAHEGQPTDAGTHDCHEPMAPPDVVAIDAGAQPCTHARFESVPAKPTPPVGDVLALGPRSGRALRLPSGLALVAVVVSPDISLTALSWRAVVPAVAHPARSAALVLPLRI